jgi:2-oxoglutarate ferredoxin oxidoreductase subunit alpha
MCSAPEGDVLLVGWGSTQGPIREAVIAPAPGGSRSRRCTSSTSIRLPNGLEAIFSGFRHVYVIEMNDGGLYGYGQLGALLRARYCDPRIEGINKTDGLTWKVREILDHGARPRRGSTQRQRV